MIRKGIVSEVNSNKKTVRVTFVELDGVVTYEFPLLFHPIKNAEIKGGFSSLIINNSSASTAVLSGSLDINYIPDYHVNDTVIVGYYGSSITEGVVLGKIEGDK